MNNLVLVGENYLPSSPTVQAKLEEIREAQAIIERLRKELDQEVEQIQQACKHERVKKVVSRKEGYPAVTSELLGTEVLDAKICKDCGKKTRRPRGSPRHVCHKCWGKMISNGYSYRGDVKIFLDKCEDCDHEVFST